MAPNDEHGMLSCDAAAKIAEDVGANAAHGEKDMPDLIEMNPLLTAMVTKVINFDVMSATVPD